MAALPVLSRFLSFLSLAALEVLSPVLSPELLRRRAGMRPKFCRCCAFAAANACALLQGVTSLSCLVCQSRQGQLEFLHHLDQQVALASFTGLGSLHFVVALALLGARFKGPLSRAPVQSKALCNDTRLAETLNPKP